MPLHLIRALRENTHTLQTHFAGARDVLEGNHASVHQRGAAQKGDLLRGRKRRGWAGLT
jgi:hypothetical protein